MIFIAVVFTASAYTQNNPDIKRTMHWYFGHDAGLDFNTLPPVADTNANDSLVYTLFSMSDTCGNLLFYGGMHEGNKLLIFNKNHNLMGIISPYSGYHPLVCPQPGNDSLYYIFYHYYDFDYKLKFGYAIVNMNKNNGLGEVLISQIVLLDSLVYWSPAATHHCNGKDIWIVNKMTDNFVVDSIQPGNKIYAWLLSENGLNFIPVISEVVIKPEWERAGLIRFSPDGSKAVAFFRFLTTQMPDSSWIELYKFDNCTGIFSNPIIIDPLPAPSGLCFSPDNTKLYIFSDFVIMYWHPGEELFAQYDVSNWNLDSILASKTIIKTGPIYGSFQIGVDGKIYVFDMDTSVSVNWGGEKIGVITEPNLSGVSCNYIPEQIDLLGAFHDQEYIPFVESYFKSFNYYPCGNNISEENFKIKLLNIYPNPTNDCVVIENLEEKNNYYVKVYNINNELIYEAKMNNTLKEQIDLSSFSSGIYLIQIFDNCQVS